MDDDKKPGDNKEDRSSGEPEEGNDAFMVACPVCNERFDMRDLGDTIVHWHDDAEPTKPN